MPKRRADTSIACVDVEPCTRTTRHTHLHGLTLVATSRSDRYESGRVGVPHHAAIDLSGTHFYRNIIITGGPAPTRAYIDDLLPDVMQGRIQPGRVFDRTVDLEGVPDGYRAMNDREALKVMVRP